MTKALPGIGLVLILGGCAAAPPASEIAAAPQGSAAESPVAGEQTLFAAVAAQMTPEQVIAAIGAPSKITSGLSGKQWIPFYFGADTGRTYWSYKGVGFVVFSQNSHSGKQAVIQTRYDASAP